MATNTQRNSIDLKGSPNITIVEAAEPKRNGKMCCMCVPEIVGVFAILSMYFFLGIFGAAASFVSLGSANDAPVKGLLSISGTLHTFIAIASALGITAIRKEKIVMMRRLSIAFWILTALMLIFNLIIFILDIVFKNQTVQDCENNVYNDFGDAGKLIVDCNRAVNASLTVEGLKLAFYGIISLYFAYVVSRFARKMKKEVLPFTAGSANGQNTPTYFVYSTQPPTSTNWVPPPTYSVRPIHPLPEDYNPELKNVPLN